MKTFVTLTLSVVMLAAFTGLSAAQLKAQDKKLPATGVADATQPSGGPMQATTVKGSKSNSDNRTTVKSSKSNSQD